MPPPPRRRSSGQRASGEQTREQILAAAEKRFAERGFGGARLEDIASDVGIKRAAIFYHFRDKHELYEATLRRVFDDFVEQGREELLGDRPVSERMLEGLGAWIDFVGRRPSVGRLILREAANARNGEPSPIAAQLIPLVKLLRESIEEGERSGELAPVADPFQFISTMGATTIFHLAAMPVLTPQVPFDPLSPTALERHKRDMLRLARIMLGVAEPAQGSGRSRRAR